METVVFSHQPVLLAECLAALEIRPGGLYLDGTAGGAGHSAAIAERLNAAQGGHLYAFDQDPDAIAAATVRLRGLPATVIQANFREAAALLMAQGINGIDGALLDLGVSSHQLDDRSRGFSYHGAMQGAEKKPDETTTTATDEGDEAADAPLDMRMSQSGPTAADLVATLSRQELADILREFGEEKFAWQIAGKLVAAREEAPVDTTGRLAEIVLSALPPAERRKAKNPARKTFQALRIAVNGELDALSEGLDTLFELLNLGGRLAVISFHSLEDRIVKQKFRALATACTCPPQLPVCVCGGVAKGKLVGKNPITAAEDELEENRRSRSAKLRVIEKL